MRLSRRVPGPVVVIVLRLVGSDGRTLPRPFSLPFEQKSLARLCDILVFASSPSRELKLQVMGARNSASFITSLEEFPGVNRVAYLPVCLSVCVFGLAAEFHHLPSSIL